MKGFQLFRTKKAIFFCFLNMLKRCNIELNNNSKWKKWKKWKKEMNENNNTHTISHIWCYSIPRRFHVFCTDLSKRENTNTDSRPFPPPKKKRTNKIFPFPPLRIYYDHFLPDSATLSSLILRKIAPFFFFTNNPDLIAPSSFPKFRSEAISAALT